MRCQKCGKMFEMFVNDIAVCGQCKAKLQGKKVIPCPCCNGKGWRVSDL